MSKLKAAVIGFGKIGSLHAQAYYQHPSVTLEAVAETNEAKLAEARDTFGCHAYASVEDLLDQHELDAVSVCTPESSHLEIGQTAAEQGIAVLMEKPMAPTVETADQMIQIADDKNAFISVNYILRFDQRVQHAKALLESRDIGEPVTFSAKRRGTVQGARFYGQWTDLLISTAIHDIDLMVHFNKADAVRVYGEKVRKNNGQYGTDDGYMFIIKFADGTIGSMETSWVLPAAVPAPLDAGFQLVGTQGSLQIDGSNQGMSVVTNERYDHPDLIHWPMVNNRLEGNLRRSIDTFVEAVLNGEEPPVPVREARKSLDIVEKIHQSIQEERPIQIDWGRV